MDELISNVLLGVPESVANLQLPDPMLRDFYRDEVDRIFWLDGSVGDGTLELVKMIISCNKEDKDIPVEERKPIRVMINSHGGDVQVMLVVIKAMRMSKTPVYTINFCEAMSAAAEILAAGHKRYALPGTCVMVHSGSVGYGGTVEQAESTKKYVDSLLKRTKDEFLSHTNIDAKTLKRKGANDWYMDEEEALQQGIIDEVLTDYNILF